MSVVSGLHLPSPSTGLIMHVDSANRKSSIRSSGTSLINTDNWAVGATSVTGYSFNQTTASENALVAISDDPWGGNSIAWETRPSGDGNNDGGWNTSSISIDNTKLYRFSVWVRRTSSTTGGTFYLGTGGYGQDVVRTDNSATQGNAYWECENIGVFTQNVWYLVCGHIYPYGTTYTGRHPDTGMFTVAGGTTKVREVNGCNVGQDLKWDAGTTGTLHRTYHFYCGDSTSRLQFCDPRVDLCDGDEPSIGELLTRGPSKLYDTSGNGNHLTTVNYPKFSSSSAGVTQFSASATQHAYNTLDLRTTTSTVISAARYSGSTRGRIVNGYQNNWLMGHWGSTTENYYAGGWVTSSSSGPNDTNWRITAAISDYGSDLYQLYVNGALKVSNANGVAGPQGISVGRYAPGNSEYSDAELGFILVYNRVLTADEIQQVFNAYRGRYGL